MSIAEVGSRSDYYFYRRYFLLVFVPMQLSFKFCHRSERAIKPFVLGRKACLFSQTAKGANASATLYSIIETAKANGLVPYDYLVHVIEKIMQGDTEPEQLLPWNVKLG
jgi:hypothetical protein